MRRRLIAIGCVVAALGALPGAAGAHPEEAGEEAIPWASEPLPKLWTQEYAASVEPDAAAAEPAIGPGIENLRLVGNIDKDGTTNSDLAFWGNLAYAGHYGGFRILDIRRDEPRVVVDHPCNGPQNDVSVWDVGARRLMFQSIDTPQDSEDCQSRNAPLEQTAENVTYRVGYEGVRIFDVTNPAAPVFLDMVQTACGSHTHTLVPDAANRRVFIYVSSYPLGTANTPPGVEGPGEFRRCEIPHKKISVIEVPYTFRAPGDAQVVEHALSDDTEFYAGFQACHDIQVFMPKRIAVGACAGDAQIWDISNLGDPTTDNGEPQTHIDSPSVDDSFEFIHSGIVSWDGQRFAVMDETGGGVTAECDGDLSNDGFYYFYDLVRPGDPAPPLLGRYTIPRPQAEEICVSHNASVIPVRGRDLMTVAYYQGGVSVVDFSDPTDPREIAWSDLEDATGAADEWSSYWYNDRLFSNSGLGRRGDTANRGVDVYRPDGPLVELTAGAKRFRWSNPQTQEATQVP